MKKILSVVRLAALYILGFTALFAFFFALGEEATAWYHAVIALLMAVGIGLLAVNLHRLWRDDPVVKAHDRIMRSTPPTDI